MTNLFCFGLGYSAEALARRVRPLGWHVAGTVRTPEKAERLAALGYETFVFDGTSPSPAVRSALANATHLVASAAPDDDGDPALRCHATDIATAPNLRWIGYLSTIGVYGNTDGAWIDETAATNPGSPRAKRRVAAETAWLAFGKDHGKRVGIFRLGGIYGPGRSPIDDVRSGNARRIVKPGQVFNRIHVEDIASVLLAAAEGRGTETVYNVVDGDPSPSADVVAYAAELLGVAPPLEIPIDDADLSPMAQSFFAENRRVRNARLSYDLGITLACPNYREGLKAILAAGRT